MGCHALPYPPEVLELVDRFYTIRQMPARVLEAYVEIEWFHGDAGSLQSWSWVGPHVVKFIFDSAVMYVPI